MHKSDPYIMALAMSESNRRKEMRAASQGAQGGQEQPKVVDQEIARMGNMQGASPEQMARLSQLLEARKQAEYKEFTGGGREQPIPQQQQQLPEDQGIGQLPAGNMNFADGGIIAFADGGDVERYQYGGMPPQSSMMGDIPGFVAGTPIFQTQPGVPEEEPILRRLYREMSERNTAARNAEERRRVSEGRAAPSERMLAETAAAKVNPAQDMAQFDAASNLYMTERAAKQAAAAAPKAAPAAPTADTTRKGPGAGPAGPIAGPRQPAQAGLGDLATTYADILKKQDFKDPAEARLGALEKKELAAAEDAKAALLRDQSKFDDAYKGREKRLSDRELDIGKQKDTNTGLALLNAGLAIMSTPGGLATAIGKGAQVGTAQFASGLDKIRSAQERLDDARDKMEDLKLNRAEMSAKEIRAAEKDIRNVGIDAEKRGIDGIRMAADVNRKTAAEMFKATVDVGVNRERIASAEKISGNEISAANARSAAQIAATLNTPDRLVFDQLLKKNDNDAVKAAEALQKMKAEKFNMYEAYSKYLTGFAGKETVTPPENFDQFAARFVVPTTKTPGKGATVLQQP
jgi:hypothetical protein